MFVRSLQMAMLVAVVFLSGCQRPAEGDGKGKVAVAPPSKDAVRIAFVTNNPYNFWIFAQRGAEKAGKDLGAIVEVKMPPKGTAEEQQQFVEDLITKGVKGIAISPNDAENMSDFIGRANKRIPMLTVDSDIPNPANRRGYLGTHNYRAGRETGKLVMEAAPEGGKVIIFVGAMDVTNAVERRQGVLDVLAGKDGTEMTDKTPPDAKNLTVGKYVLLDTITDDRSEDKCQQKCEDILLKTPDTAVIVGLWEYNPPAMLRAAKKVNSKVKIVGFDENDQTLQGIIDGTVYATVVQSPYKFGTESVKILAGLAKGDEKALSEYPGIQANNRIFVPHRVINKDNVEAFRKECDGLLGK